MPRPDTVIVLHGLWMPAPVMGLLARRLRRCGYRVRVFGYRTLTAPLEENARRLAAFVRAQDTGVIHLVGHSLGGLVILEALQTNPGLIDGRIVLLGSPVRGSEVARRLQRLRGAGWLLGRSAGRGLLGAGPAWQGGKRLGVIAGDRPVGIGRFIGGLVGDNDGTVAVAETRLEQAGDSIRVHTTHSGLILSRRVAGEVCVFLRDGHFSHA